MEKQFNPYQAKGTVLFSRFRKFFLGKNIPGLFTRIVCNFGFAFFFYLFLWSMAVFIAFEFGQNLPKADNWNKLFTEVGLKYNISNIHLSFTFYLLGMLAASSFLFIGLLLVWRKKTTGHWFVLISTLACPAMALILLGVEYMKKECGWWEYLIYTLIFVLFLIDFILRKRKTINQ